MEASDEGEDTVLFAFTPEFDTDIDCEEDILAALGKAKKSRSLLPVGQLADLYLQASEHHRVEVIKALCDVFTRHFKLHRNKYTQAELHQIVANSLENLASSDEATKKVLLLLSKFRESGVKFEVRDSVLLEAIERVISRSCNSPGDIEATKHVLGLITAKQTDTSTFNGAFCKIADLISESNDIREKIEKEFLGAVSLDEHITVELFEKLVRPLLGSSYGVQSKIRLLEVVHKILNINNSFVYSADDDEFIDTLTSVAKELFSTLYNSPCPTSSDARLFNMLISLVAKLKNKTPAFLEVEPRKVKPATEMDVTFSESDLFPELHVNVTGSADYTSDYKKCKCSSKCSCESICLCGCTKCQRPPIIGKAELYKEFVHTKEGFSAYTQDGAAEHAYANLKSPLLKIFDDDEQFERILQSISADSEQVPEWEEVDDGKKLTFTADFESGNLQSARRVGEYDYELVLYPDTGTTGNSQWFYFSITGMIPKETYNFKIINMEKSRTLFNNGQRVVLFSQKLYDERTIGWIRAGTDISYYGNKYRRKNSTAQIYHTLSFSLTFKYPDDRCWIALYYPYTPSALRKYLSDKVAEHRSRNIISWTSSGGCDIATLTDFTYPKADILKRKYVFVLGRIKPCEAQSTFVAQGLIDFLLKEGNAASTYLLRKYVFKIIPIANPSGVTLGNSETDISGTDLNISWELHSYKPGGEAIAIVKMMMESVGQKTSFFIDIQGTCKRSNCFVLGCAPPNEVGRPLSEKVFSYILWCARSDYFSFSDCRYDPPVGKLLGSGRAFARKEYGILNSFNFFATSAGLNFGPLSGAHLNPGTLLKFGEYLGEVIHEYASSPSTKKESIINQIYAMYKQYYPDYVI